MRIEVGQLDSRISHGSCWGLRRCLWIDLLGKCKSLHWDCIGVELSWAQPVQHAQTVFQLWKGLRKPKVSMTTLVEIWLLRWTSKFNALTCRFDVKVVWCWSGSLLKWFNASTVHRFDALMLWRFDRGGTTSKCPSNRKCRGVFACRDLWIYPNTSKLLHHITYHQKNKI